MNSIIFDLFFLDIETVPQNSSYTSMPHESKILWEQKISKTLPENTTAEECYTSKAGILAEFGKIICISAGFLYKNEKQETCLKIKSIYGDDEKELLKNFIELADRVCKLNSNFEFSGHNIREFDLPYICRRILINRLPLPSYLNFHGAKPWEIKMLDTMQLWKFGDYKNYISLNLLAHVLDVPTSKTDIDGSKVFEVYYFENNLKRIVEYCQKDVLVVANIILRFKNCDIVKDENVVIVDS